MTNEMKSFCPKKAWDGSWKVYRINILLIPGPKCLIEHFQSRATAVKFLYSMSYLRDRRLRYDLFSHKPLEQCRR
jgi:hypothetical protein